MLLFKEFEILRIAESSKEKLSQREFAKETGLSVGTVNTTLTTLEEKGFIKDGLITKEVAYSVDSHTVKV